MDAEAKLAPPAADPDAGRLCARLLYRYAIADPKARPIVYPDVLASSEDAVANRFKRTRVGDNVLKGTRDGILKKVQPVSIHGQVSWDVYFTDVEDPDGQINVARVGPEAVMGHNLEPGDRIQVEYVVGVAIRVTRLVPAS